ncbi:glycoside hydrolase family 23 protein [Hydnum rufescens UP504]|uniref:Glycoside hydrolase family 23 protein n=1 Tax=Hydnum rufescens UP504 TaxID=1448309 RepID=A0A9P6E060_9AGAM|nr:glycoside hydrolase family 23 protein [Hydnum rufescens UP504]
MLPRGVKFSLQLLTQSFQNPTTTFPPRRSLLIPQAPQVPQAPQFLPLPLAPLAPPHPAPPSLVSSKSLRNSAVPVVPLVRLPIHLLVLAFTQCLSTAQVTPTDGPNGRLLWLNCGVDGGGWNPPFIRASDLITQDLTTALKNPNSPFKSCAPYLDLFNKYANINGIPPILATSISMQESGCNPATVGGAGEQGLMQITQDKCGGAPGGNCRDPDFNIRTGLAYFKSTLDSNGGNVLLTMGQYNGWDVGMTIAKATAAAHTGCCRCQNNLDYLQQVMNGWLQNLDPYAANLGLYFNLNKCN